MNADVCAPGDAVITGAGVVLSLVALVAEMVPAQRASRVEPMTALRYE